MSLEVVSFLSAEIVLVAAALVIYMGGAFSTSQKAWAPIEPGYSTLAPTTAIAAPSSRPVVIF